MFNINLTKQKLLRKQSIAILSILIGGSLLSIAYATGTVITNTGITTGDLTVTGTCTGCTNERSFTTYSLSLNSTVTGSSGFSGQSVIVGDDGSTVVSDVGNISFGLAPNGTVIRSATIATAFNSLDVSGESLTGKYKIMYNTGNGTLAIIKDNTILQKIDVDTTHSFVDHVLAVGISPNGKYIGIFGDDLSNTIDRIQVWQGS